MNIKTFAIDAKLNYQEFYCNGELINKYYEIDNCKTKCMISTIPDACVDIQFAKIKGKLIIYACGSFLESKKSPIAKQEWSFGVKFNPGVVPALVRDCVMELIGNRRELKNISWLDSLANSLLNAKSFQERIKLFENLFPFEEQFETRNEAIDYVMRRIREENGCSSIARIVEETGYSQKYIDRIFRVTTGLTMKKYASIIRIQTAIYYLQEKKSDEIYERLKYYDQSYFIKDFKKNTKMTPRQFCREKGISIV